MVRRISLIHSSRPVESFWKKDDLKKHFEGFDSNNDGKLSFKELQEALRKLGVLNHIKNHIKTAKAMDYADANNDEFINLNDQEFDDLIDHIYNLRFKIN